MDDLRVIMEVQRHRILYDTANPFYKDNYRKEQAWSEISAALGADRELQQNITENTVCS